MGNIIKFTPDERDNISNDDDTTACYCPNRAPSSTQLDPN